MEKKNIVLIIVIIVLSVCVLGLGGFIVYDKLFNDEPVVENSKNDDGKSEDKYSELIETSLSKYEDDKYIRYELFDAHQFASKMYLVYDKENKVYINDSLSDGECICYFDKINGEYYYFVLSVPSVSAYTEIYSADGTLIKSIDGAYVSFDEETITFKFETMPTMVEPVVEYWSPINN